MTNWQVAKAYYLGLPRERRSFAEVARKFKVSDVRVGQVARAAGWPETAAAVDERVERRAVTMIVRSRAERLARTLELYDRAADATLKMLPLDANGDVDVKALEKAKPKLEALLSGMPGLFKMAELAAGETTDRVAIAEIQPVLIAFAKIAVVHAPAETRGQVIRELEAASAGLVRLDDAA